jgi:hypothetical protein
MAASPGTMILNRNDKGGMIPLKFALSALLLVAILFRFGAVHPKSHSDLKIPSFTVEKGGDFAKATDDPGSELLSCRPIIVIAATSYPFSLTELPGESQVSVASRLSARAPPG